LAPTTMKNAAKCDTSCELQKLVSHQVFERTLRFRDMPGSMLVGVRSQQPTFPLFFPREKEEVGELCASGFREEDGFSSSVVMGRRRERRPKRSAARVDAQLAVGRC